MWQVITASHTIVYKLVRKIISNYIEEDLYFYPSHETKAIVFHLEEDEKSNIPEGLGMVTLEQIKYLQKLGFYIEEIGDSEWKGYYRFMNSKTGQFQQSDPCDTKYDAWVRCVMTSFSRFVS